MLKIILRATFTWFGLFILAIINGVIREYVLKDYLNAQVLSVISGTILWTAFVWLIWNKTQIKTLKEATVVGLYWFILTAMVETFLMNKLIGKMTWDEILATYNLAKGQYFGIVPLWIGLMPIVIRGVKVHRVKR